MCCCFCFYFISLSMNQSFPGTMQSRVLTHSTNVCIFVSHCCRSNLNTGACSYYCSCAVYCRWTWFITGSSDCHGVRMRSELKKTSTVRPWKFIFMAICKGVCEGASTKKKKKKKKSCDLDLVQRHSFFYFVKAVPLHSHHRHMLQTLLKNWWGEVDSVVMCVQKNHTINTPNIWSESTGVLYHHTGCLN